MPRLPRLLLEAPPPEVLIIPVENDFVIMLASFLCTLICVIGLIAAGRCALRRCLRNLLGTSSSESTAANKGVKKKVLNSLPIINYNTTTNTSTTPPVNQHPPALNVTACAVCLAEFVEGDDVRVLPLCCHGFHVSCIDEWLKSHSCCPSCRQGVGKFKKCDKSTGEAAAGMNASTSNATENTFLP